MPVLLPTKKLQAICDPLRFPPWDCPQFERSAVSEAIKQNRLNPIPFSDGLVWNDDSLQHIERIAYLVVHGWNDAIEMDVGVPSLNFYVDWPVLDGNHRLAAAIYAKYPTILASVSGAIDYALELFGVDVSEPEYAQK